MPRSRDHQTLVFRFTHLLISHPREANNHLARSVDCGHSPPDNITKPVFWPSKRNWSDVHLYLFQITIQCRHYYTFHRLLLLFTEHCWRFFGCMVDCMLTRNSNTHSINMLKRKIICLSIDYMCTRLLLLNFLEEVEICKRLQIFNTFSIRFHDLLVVK